MIQESEVRVKRIVGKETGASVVEFAVVLPLLMLFIVGIIYFGVMLNSYEILTHAAREGVRHASLRENDAQIKRAVIEAAPTLNPNFPSDPPATKFTIAISPPTRVSGQSTEVDLAYYYDFLPVSNVLEAFKGEGVKNFASGGIWLRTKAIMRVE
jgi:hypothetical protein